MSITLVQSNQASPTGTGTSFAVTLPVGVTQGNLLVIAAAVGNNATTITGPSGWTQAVINQPAGSSATIETSIWYLVVGAGQAGQTSWTFTLSASHTAYLCVEEWHSTAGWPASPLDVTAQGDTTGTPTTATVIDSGTTTTTAQANELWVASLAYKNSAQTESSITTGWTKDQESTLASNNTMTLLYKVASATGTADCTYTIGTAQYWAGVAATFKDNSSSIVTGSATLVGQGVESQSPTLLLTPATEQANATLAQSAKIVTGSQPLSASATLAASARILTSAVEQSNSVLQATAIGNDVLQANATLAVTAQVLAPTALSANATLTDTVLLQTSAVEQANSVISTSARLLQAADALAGNAVLAVVPVGSAVVQGNGSLSASAQVLSPASLDGSATLVEQVVLQTSAQEQANSILTDSALLIASPATLASNSILAKSGWELQANTALSASGQVLAPISFSTSAALPASVRLITSADEQSSSVLGESAYLVPPPVVLSGSGSLSDAATLIVGGVTLSSNASLTPSPQVLASPTSLAATSACSLVNPPKLLTHADLQAQGVLTEGAVLIAPPESLPTNSLLVLSPTFLSSHSALPGNSGLSAFARVISAPATLQSEGVQPIARANVLSPAPLNAAAVLSEAQAILLAPVPLSAGATLSATAGLRTSATLVGQGVLGGGYYGTAALADAPVYSLTLGDGVVGSATLSDTALATILLGDT